MNKFFERGLARLAEHGITPSANLLPVVELLERWCGLHHLGQPCHRLDWKGTSLEVFLPIVEMGTHDDRKLLDLVLLSLALRVRVVLSPAGNLQLRLHFSPADSGLYSGTMPTLQEVVAEMAPDLSILCDYQSRAIRDLVAVLQALHPEGHASRDCRTCAAIAQGEAMLRASRGDGAVSELQLRPGQALFEAMLEVDPSFAESIRGGDLDPYHVSERMIHTLRTWALRLRDAATAAERERAERVCNAAAAEWAQAAAEGVDPASVERFSARALQASENAAAIRRGGE